MIPLCWKIAWRFTSGTTRGVPSSILNALLFFPECRRYVMSPGQPSSYAVGKLQVTALRDEYAKKMGDRFSLRDFHDRLLAEGSIPVSLIRRKLLAE